MLNLLISLFGALVPQMDEPPGVQYMWRLKVAGFLSLCCTCLPLLVMASTGHLWGFTGFLPRSDFEAYIRESHLLREERLAVDLLALQAARCKTPTEEAKRLYTANIDTLERQYQDLTGHDYHLIDCSYL